tara:strand:+ start:207 stop:671 length:465 start_codon:yes stop_codon:yes gene_type:complete
MRLILLIFFLNTSLFYSQAIVTVSGGNATGIGSVSYTVGQLVVNTNIASSGSVAQGIQQSIELYTLSNPDLKTLTLKALTYPNPTSDKIILSLLDNKLKELFYSIYDINGRLIKNGKVNQENTPIAMKYMAAGIYLLKVHQNKKQLKVFKIIKN